MASLHNVLERPKCIVMIETKHSRTVKTCHLQSQSRMDRAHVLSVLPSLSSRAFGGQPRADAGSDFSPSTWGACLCHFNNTLQWGP